jgi:pyruvate kinase
MSTSNHEFILTKIIATLGPATSEVSDMVEMIENGANVFRVNFSHGELDSFKILLDNIREASKRTGHNIGVLADLSGPKFRIGKVAEGGVELVPGKDVILSSEDAAQQGDAKTLTVSVNNPIFIPELKVGQHILLNDGEFVLECSAILNVKDNPEAQCKVISGGLLTSDKGINLPDTKLSLPSLTAWDLRCIDFAVEHGFDFLALSFVRSGKDVQLLKARLRELGARPSMPKRSAGGSGPRFSSYGGGSKSFIPVMAKIEKPEALDDLESIVDESDIIMIARGDLGVEMDLAKVPVIQRKIIKTCHDQGKPVVVATQMLQSMIEAPTPTRAEVSDVANAILDGAHAVMLSGESAVGSFPVESVKMMRRIARETNMYRRSEEIDIVPPRNPRASRYRTAALAHGVSVVVRALDAKLIVMWSQLGGGASYVSQMRSSVPVIALSSNPEALRRMSILYGLFPFFMDQPESTAAFILQLDKLLIDQKWAQKGDPIVLVLGEPIGQEGLTNKIQIHYVGDALARED